MAAIGLKQYKFVFYLDPDCHLVLFIQCKHAVTRSDRGIADHLAKFHKQPFLLWSATLALNVLGYLYVSLHLPNKKARLSNFDRSA